MRSFRVIIIIFVEHSQPSIHAAVLYIFLMLKFAIILSSQRNFFLFISDYQSRWKKATYCSSYIFRAESFKLKWEKPLEVATFSQNDFFSEYLIAWNNYFFLINTFSDQLLLEDKNFSVQMLLRRSYFFRISNCLEHVLFRGR